MEGEIRAIYGAVLSEGFVVPETEHIAPLCIIERCLDCRAEVVVITEVYLKALLLVGDGDYPFAVLCPKCFDANTGMAAQAAYANPEAKGVSAMLQYFAEKN